MLRRGSLCRLPDGGTVLIVSGDMYNDLPDHPFVLCMDIVQAGTQPPFHIALRGVGYVETDSIERVPKTDLSPSGETVTVQQLTDIDNALFRVLATN